KSRIPVVMRSRRIVNFWYGRRRDQEDTMSTHLATSAASAVRYLVSCCPKCGSQPIAPRFSEYLGEGRIRNCWGCDSCGEEFAELTRIAADRFSLRTRF